MKGFNTYIVEARQQRPSGWTRTKKKTRKVTNTYLAGDVYDFHSGTYQQEDEYVDSEYEGFIFDKEGNEYKVYGDTKQGDAGRISGGSTSYYVTIKGNGITINLSGYLGLFSSGRGTGIIYDIGYGYYLEDYLVKNNDGLSSKEESKEEVAKLMANGDKDAESYTKQKEDRAANKELEFARRYVEFSSLTIEKSKEGGKLYIRPAYKNSKANGDQEAQVSELLEPFITQLLEGAFGLPMDQIYGIRAQVKIACPDKGRVCPALDVKKKNLVFIKAEFKGLDKPDKKIVLDDTVELKLGSVVECWYKNASPKLQEYTKVLYEKLVKDRKKSRSSWIKITADQYYGEYENYYWGKRKYTRKEAHELAVAAWDSMIRKYNPDAQHDHTLTYIDTELLAEYVKSIKPEFNVQAKAPDTSVNDLPEVETVAKPAEAPKKERGKETVMSKGAKAAAYDKMKAWHEGTRKQNVGAMSDAKLKMNYAVCKELGFDKEVDILKAEADKRELTLESRLTMKEYAELISE